MATSLQRQLAAEASAVAQLLRRRDVKIVFAESCTGGLIAATLTRIPGISDYLCGSAVVYQIDTKASWLEIPRSLLKKPGPVSRQVASEMARRVLEKTPQADVAAAITGHLGPDAPKKLDGLLYAAVALRSRQPRGTPEITVHRHRLDAADVGLTAVGTGTLRTRRQMAAAKFVLSMVRTQIEIRPEVG